MRSRVTQHLRTITHSAFRGRHGIEKCYGFLCLLPPPLPSPSLVLSHLLPSIPVNFLLQHSQHTVGTGCRAHLVIRRSWSIHANLTVVLFPLLLLLHTLMLPPTPCACTLRKSVTINRISTAFLVVDIRHMHLYVTTNLYGTCVCMIHSQSILMGALATMSKHIKYIK